MKCLFKTLALIVRINHICLLANYIVNHWAAFMF